MFDLITDQEMLFIGLRFMFSINFFSILILIPSNSTPNYFVYFVGSFPFLPSISSNSLSSESRIRGGESAEEERSCRSSRYCSHKSVSHEQVTRGVRKSFTELYLRKHTHIHKKTPLFFSILVMSMPLIVSVR